MAAKPKSETNKTTSGDRRQPRLQDILRLETEVATLNGKVEMLLDRPQSPFQGMNADDVFVMVMFAMTAANKTKTTEKVIFNRGMVLLNAFKEFRKDGEKSWEKAKRLAREEREELEAQMAKRELRIKDGKEGVAEAPGPVIEITGGRNAPLVPSE